MTSRRYRIVRALVTPLLTFAGTVTLFSHSILVIGPLVCGLALWLMWRIDAPRGAANAEPLPFHSRPTAAGRISSTLLFFLAAVALSVTIPLALLTDGLAEFATGFMAVGLTSTAAIGARTSWAYALVLLSLFGLGLALATRFAHF